MTKGYDKMNVDVGLVFDMSLDEGSGNPNDSARPHHPLTMSGTPAWASLANGVGYLSFVSAHPDYVQCLSASCADLDFTTGNFSGTVWIYPTTTSETLMHRGTLNVSGWVFIVSSNEISVYTNHPAWTVTRGIFTGTALNVWHFMSFTRNGTSIRVYDNAIDVTTTIGTHNAITSSASNFYFGASAAGISNAYNGYLASARIWSRALSPQEVLWIFNRERYFYGV